APREWLLGTGASIDTSLPPSRSSTEGAEEPLYRIIELVDHPFLQGDDGVVGDGDPFGADLGAALGDVAVADALGLPQLGEAVLDVQRMHLQSGGVDEQPGSDELLVQVVVAQHVADVLAEEA